MSCDKLVFDLSQEVEGSPNVFIRKDWINILDNQNQNYQNNQSIIDTSQLANSNKYMGYREAYLAIPMLLSMRTLPQAAAPGGPITPRDYSVGLKNWFGTIIHSMTLDYNGTTIVQQTPFCNLWNSFKLLTTLSWADVITQGCSIGFYPDTPDSFRVNSALAGPPVAASATSGLGITNNFNGNNTSVTNGTLLENAYNQPIVAVPGNCSVGGNNGLTMRTKWIAYSPNTVCGTADVNPTYGTGFLSAANSGLIWKSHISNRAASAAEDQRGILQISIMATVYLKHLHSFFNMCPLLKGVFMKLTLNLNNSKATIDGTAAAVPLLSCSESTSYIGGTQPMLIPSSNTGGYTANAPKAGSAFYDLTVGSRSYNNSITNPVNGGPPSQEGQVSKSIYLYVPAYTFNPTFEQAYLSNNIKQIKYTDIYQYQFDVDTNPAQFNQLITNGIANIKSVLIVPVSRLPIQAIANPPNIVEYLSPFSPCGGGTTCPMTTLTNFNVQISGQNAIYNMQKYSFEEWNNQLYGQNSVNGGLTDGLTSGLIDFFGFQTSYSYYYVNVERMLPVEQSVPKSVQLIGQNYTNINLRLMVFIEYGVQVSIDVLTGARV
jgi:hypothetical protein